jgi:RNA polymerase sigma-70 factor (ECF subfamily)
MDAHELIESLRSEHAGFVRMARRRVESHADAEDVVQRALLRAAERSSSVLDPTRARAWFYRILRRTIADHHERRRPSELEISAVEDALPAAAPEHRTPCACALRLLAELRPGYAELLRRLDLEDEDVTSVARALGISNANLYVRLHRARNALRERVAAHCGVSSASPCLECTCGGRHRCGN